MAWEMLKMSQRPRAVGLMLCDRVVYEQGTQKPYLLGVFTGVAVDNFPTAPQRIDIFAALNGGQGEVTMTWSVEHLDTDQAKKKLPHVEFAFIRLESQHEHRNPQFTWSRQANAG